MKADVVGCLGVGSGRTRRRIKGSKADVVGCLVVGSGRLSGSARLSSGRLIFNMERLMRAIVHLFLRVYTNSFIFENIFLRFEKIVKSFLVFGKKFSIIINYYVT